MGIDPGIATLGFGIIRVLDYKPGKSTANDENNLSKVKLQLIDYGCIKTLPETPMPTRLYQIYQGLHKLIKNYKPQVMAIERLFFGINLKTAMVVGQARGIILLSTAKFPLEIAEFAPLQVKNLVTGYGRTQKNGVKEIVRKILKMKETPKSDDAADALAVAICAAIKTSENNRSNQNSSSLIRVKAKKVKVGK